MDLWQLHIFVSVVENKSFSKASCAINLSQPTVSSHIKELEDHFKCRLLDRLGKITEPTKAGEILYQYSKKLLTLRDQSEAAMNDFLGRTKGNLFIGGSTIPSCYIIPRLIGPFSKQFPDISIELTAGDTMEIVQKIKKGSIEIGIVGAKIDDPQIKQEKLVADEMKLIVPYNHKWADQTFVDCSNLFEERFIAREKGSGTWQSILKSMDEAGLNSKKLNTSITMGNTVSVIQGILNHVGISILSTIAVQDDINKGRLKALSVKGLDLDRFFYLTLSKKRTLSPICNKFIEFARQPLHTDETA
ncbi:selenium metabolism-associated LysR family transcriptional regulator [Desulfobacula toluolica]|uniref:LysR: transcriptional regulator n=1 Tax=Desulfobacula toluolica (strain DSM 7467 / Tol2) TaxID=651182 RepID=K0NDA3_DESTT|nr:selenium metabolism-associated LysR family transcriptional regulator [Desulfobacula toluolica]CCK78770.1 LysR: transcriptional regulator [Desulfobacula toluolica Tol2]